MAKKRLFRITIYEEDGRKVKLLSRTSANRWIQRYLTEGLTFIVESL